MKTRGEGRAADEETRRPEDDFSHGKRGGTARRDAQGANGVVIAPAVRDVGPDGGAGNEALRARSPVPAPAKSDHGGKLMAIGDDSVMATGRAAARQGGGAWRHAERPCVRDPKNRHVRGLTP